MNYNRNTTNLEAHEVSCKMGTGSFPGVRCSWGVMLTSHPPPLLVPRAKIEYSYTSTLPKGPCGLRKGETHLQKKFISTFSFKCRNNYFDTLVNIIYNRIQFYLVSSYSSMSETNVSYKKFLFMDVTCSKLSVFIFYRVNEQKG
jgi:hypothetical protein